MTTHKALAAAASRADERHELARRLMPWAAQYRAMRAAQDSLRALTGADCECDLMRPAWMMIGDYTDAMSRLVGDEWCWLAWYAGENDLGANGLTVKINGKNRKCATLHELAGVIIDSREVPR